MKPKVVLLSAFLSPLRSGAESCAEEIAHRAWEKFDITIVTARLVRKLPDDDPFRGHAKVVRVGLGHRIDKWLFPFLAPFAVRRIQPQVIHAVLESFAGLAMVFAKMLSPKAKAVLTCQSTNTSFLLKFMHRRADRVTVISRVLLTRAREFGRSDALLIPNGIDVPAIERACADTKKIQGRILYVGRLEAMKGVDVLLRALARLLSSPSPLSIGEGGARGERYHLRIVGSGSEEKALKHLADDLKLSEYVTFVGFVPIPRVFEEFAQAQIFCGLSRSEALGNVFLEAQAAGCAVIATHTGGIPDIVEDGRTGLLVAPDDAEAAAQAMQKLLSDSHKWQELAKAGMASARTYDWQGIVSRYEEVYRSLIE
ncbi:MAG: glycosyltransferase family 4 protein [Candidatus Peribacteraceae bacterium]|nr:glycosyltransferase family 4 protein [Candidatus Peribacteraceae bacterium]MDD5739325.1 glycosyltransferase family 4 protein [Candidatus Peribacteraceae bacterium]